MTRQVDVEYDEIKKSLLTMAGLVEEMIERAGRALEERDSELARIIMRTDRRVDEMEKEIDEHCHLILARQQPMAVDLRLLVAVMKITTDLERIGDLSNNMARSVRQMEDQPQLPPRGELTSLFQRVRQMVADVLDAFVNRDAELAMQIWQRDEEIDEGYKRFVEGTLERLESEPTSVQPAFELIMIGRSLERIADHVTNIAEDVIYYVQGIDIRHTAPDEVKE